MTAPANGTERESLLGDKHYRDIMRNNVIRLVLTYLAPLILLLIFFEVQYTNLLKDSSRNHLLSIAEYRANILDLYLRERIVNLQNLIDNPAVMDSPSDLKMQEFLDKLKKESQAFIDIGIFDSSGNHASYAGSVPFLENKSYAHELWFQNLKSGEKSFIITDIYMGIRNKPHFTIAVKRDFAGDIIILRAALEPDIIYDYMNLDSERQSELASFIINKEGLFQLVEKSDGKLLEESSFKPPKDKGNGIAENKVNKKNINYAFAWMNVAPWAVIVKENIGRGGLYKDHHKSIIIISSLVILGIFVMILFRARKYVQIEKEKDIARLQLEHAAKLASVGELAAGIAHEINNPLAIIGSEAGLIKDLLDPAFGLNVLPTELSPHLDNILEATFRGRDITRKLLGFVRHNEIQLEYIDIHEVLDEVVDGFYQKEMSVSNIKIEKIYDNCVPKIFSDKNQMHQVLMNIINNASDAIRPPGKITIKTGCQSNYMDIYISITDSGCGMDEATMSKIFLPFFTTKEVGKGTGLGLPVSYAIIKGFGGRIEIESIPGKGSTFTIILPVE